MQQEIQNLLKTQEPRQIKYNLQYFKDIIKYEGPNLGFVEISRLRKRIEIYSAALNQLEAQI